MDYCARTVTEAGAAKEVRVFGLGDFFLRRFQARCETALAEINRVRLAQVRLSMACGGLYVLALGGGFWYVAAQVGAGRLALGDIALYLGAVMQAQARLSIPAWVFG
jgi:ATP-binding cassette, subfamily B, bacterial